MDFFHFFHFASLPVSMETTFTEIESPLLHPKMYRVSIRVYFQMPIFSDANNTKSLSQKRAIFGDFCDFYSIGILGMSSEISQHAQLGQKSTAQDKLKVFMSPKCHILMCRRDQPKKTSSFLIYLSFRLFLNNFLKTSPKTLDFTPPGSSSATEHVVQTES